MTDERFDELMRDAAETFRRPPHPDLDAMWADIEARVPVRAGPQFADYEVPVTELVPRRAPRWLAIAATLVIGVGIGRASLLFNRSAAPAPTKTVVEAPGTTPRADISVDRPYDIETSRYLGQTAALLIGLPSEVKDDQFSARAGDLLTTTRLLLDSPAAKDQSMRTLLEDLELVLAQVVRLQGNHNRTEMDLINRALEQRDVIPRLRSAVADISAN